MADLPTLEPSEAYRLWAAGYPPFAHNPLMMAEERAMLSLLPTDLSGCRVLDAGCGSGRYIVHAHRRGVESVVGIDLSAAMLLRAQQDALPDLLSEERRAALIQAGLEAIPIRSDWADVTLCGLTLGHLPDLMPALSELRRVTRPGGLLLCSDFHPIGETLGWKRVFKAGDRRYAVRHTSHTLDRWHAACCEAGLKIQQVIEPRLDPADIPPDAKFDLAGLDIPVALVMALERS